MQFVMSVSVVSWCGVAVFLGAMYMLAMVMSLKCFVCIFRSCISVLSVLMVCGVLMCVNVVSDLMLKFFYGAPYAVCVELNNFYLSVLFWRSFVCFVWGGCGDVRSWSGCCWGGDVWKFV